MRHCSNFIFVRKRACLLGALVTTVFLSACGKPPPRAQDYPAPLQHTVAIGWRFSLTDQVAARVRATYSVQAYVMAVERYRWSALSDVSPVDFALAWGPAATTSVQSSIAVTQRARWFYWRLPSLSGMPSLPSLMESMANTHMVPATLAIREQLLSLRPGASIQAFGYLVDLESDTPALRRATSLTRTDSGAGSCEIFLVTKIKSH